MESWPRSSSWPGPATYPERWPAHSIRTCGLYTYIRGMDPSLAGSGADAGPAIRAQCRIQAAPGEMLVSGVERGARGLGRVARVAVRKRSAGVRGLPSSWDACPRRPKSDARFRGTYDYLLTTRGSVEPCVCRGRVAMSGAAVSCIAHGARRSFGPPHPPGAAWRGDPPALDGGPWPWARADCGW
jgi:hypothetical protein